MEGVFKLVADAGIEPTYSENMDLVCAPAHVIRKKGRVIFADTIFTFYQINVESISGHLSHESKKLRVRRNILGNGKYKRSDLLLYSAEPQ